ncbi:unnamed protein product [Withania somnifera]
MAEALPGKSRDDIIEHYSILIDDVAAIESGRVPLPNYPEMQCDSNQNTKGDVEWRRGASWTEMEHRSFLRGLDIYGRGDWKSISRNCVKTRTPTQVASHAQKYFKRLKADPNEKRRASILDITSADAEAAGTSQAMPSTKNESMLPRESTNAEQIIAVAGEESAGRNTAFVDGMDSLYPDVNDEFISSNDLTMEQEDANETGFLADPGRSLLPSKQPFTAASSGTYGPPILGIGSDLEALITEHMDEDNDINSIFDVRKAPTSHAMLFNAAHSGISSYAPENNVAAHSGMTSFAVDSIGATNASQNMVADRAAQLPPFPLI